eukprot:TRINITY_DN22506_c0_g1_i1.p1 TRINITY_DN22506_c0_g1~~TRINITY_DN22506_c0_g1_i1.p1  ORF type:complete len:130 (+),score=18.40 TRINITY_DN22506_c0_g1_i1:938-1327(+)
MEGVTHTQFLPFVSHLRSNCYSQSTCSPPFWSKRTCCLYLPNQINVFTLVLQLKQQSHIPAGLDPLYDFFPFLPTCSPLLLSSPLDLHHFSLKKVPPSVLFPLILITFLLPPLSAPLKTTFHHTSLKET